MQTLLSRPAFWALALSCSLLLGALGFQYIGGYPPCKLCHWQRYAHIAVAAVALLALLGPRRLAGPLTLAATAALMVSAGIALFHVGVEWKWWPGPAECSSSALLGLDPKEAARRLLETPIVRCDEIPWSLLGISMAGYNFIFSLAGALIVAAGTMRARRA